MKTVLGIETSCDDTSVAIVEGKPGETPVLLAMETFSQDKLFDKWGGVIPEIAARNHLAKIVPLFQDVFHAAARSPSDLDAVAVTVLPGLLGPLLTGLGAAKSLSLIFDLPVVPVNHVYAHLEAIHLEKTVPYPYLGMVVSGGHSFYALARSPEDFDILGKTLDDAAGEALDKGGKMMGLGYPAGASIDRLAQEANDKSAFRFPIGLRSSGDANLSFSGTKTSLNQRLAKEGLPSGQGLNDLCYGYLEAIVAALELKMKHALRNACAVTGGGKLPIVVGGGVACNRRLREVFCASFEDVHFVPTRFCTDNGAMIAGYGLRLFHRAVAFPDCLGLDASGSFL